MRGKSNANPWLPSKPLADAIRRIAAREERALGGPGARNENGRLKIVCERAGIGERLVWAWKVGQRPHVQLSRADEVMTALDLLWWEVYDEDSVRRPLITAHVMRGRRRQFPGRGVTAYLDRLATKTYGDTGPDRDLVEWVTAAWEGRLGESEEALEAAA